MRLLYVVQRYGEEVAGGAEQHCRDFAERLVQRGHDVDVVTTCAASYVDWANVYPSGVSTLNGVTVRRVPVALPRDGRAFALLNARVVNRSRLAPLELQREWMRMQGPFAPGVSRSVKRRAQGYDCIVFVTYLYWTTWAGLRSIAGSHATVLHPTAHDEPPLRLSLFDELFRLPDRFAFLTPEERDLVARRFPGAPGGDVVGVGVELDDMPTRVNFRRLAEIGNRPYIAYVGRIDPAKGAAELVDFFVAHKDRSPSDLVLALVGERYMDLPQRDDIISTGFVPAEMRNAAIAGALALVQPSYFESFSMVLTETFARRRPALVQARCAVLHGHAHRSGAAIPYSGFAEFDTAVETILRNPMLVDTLGERGREYVEREYAWPNVLDRYEAMLARVVADRKAPVRAG